MEEKRKCRVVIKIGTSSLTNKEDGSVDVVTINRTANMISRLKGIHYNCDVILVTSGAVGLGYHFLFGVKNITKPYSELTMADKAYCAKIGQPLLMREYMSSFNNHGIQPGQCLLAGEADYDRTLTKITLNTFSPSTLTIVNANDTVYDEQMRIGDNDCLAANVARIVHADYLFLITDVEGLKIENKKDSPLVEIVRPMDLKHYKESAGAAGSAQGTGGMKTKLEAMDIAAKFGCETHIISNKFIHAIGDILDSKLRTREDSIINHDPKEVNLLSTCCMGLHRIHLSQRQGFYQARRNRCGFFIPSSAPKHNETR